MRPYRSDCFPLGQHFRFALRQIRLHGEAGLRQVDGLLVVRHFSYAHSSIQQRRACAASRWICATIASSDSNFSSGAQELHTFDRDLAAIQIAREIEHMHLEPRLGAAHRGPRADAGHPVQRRARIAPRTRTRTAKIPASGSRRCGKRTLAVGKPSLRPSCSPRTTRPIIV